MHKRPILYITIITLAVFVAGICPGLATAAVSQELPFYTILLDFDRDQYYIGETAYFDVRLLNGQEPVALDLLEIEAVLRQKEKTLPLREHKNSRGTFSCVLNEENSAIEVTVYKKNRHDRARVLQARQEGFRNDLKRLRNSSRFLFWKKNKIDQEIGYLTAMLEKIEFSIKRLHAPLARVLENIVVLSRPAILLNAAAEEKIKETEMAVLSFDDADSSPDTAESFSPGHGDGSHIEESHREQKLEKPEEIVSGKPRTSERPKAVKKPSQTGSVSTPPKGKGKIISKEEISKQEDSEILAASTPPVAYIPPFYSRVKDAIPPVTDADYAKNGIVTNENVKITLRATDNVLGVAGTFYRINGSNWMEYDRPLSDFADGEHLLEYYSFDKGDNKEDPPKTLTVRIDRTAPALTVHYPSSTEDNTTSINGTVSDDTMAVTMDGKQILLEDGAFSISYISLPKRKNVFTFEAFDRAGNKATRDIVVECLWDKIPPAITIKGIEEGKFYSKAVAPAVGVDDTQSMVTRSITLNGEPFSSGTSISENGKYTLSVQAVDAYENHASLSVSFGVDRTAPETKDDYKRADVWSGEDVKIALLAADGGSGVEAIYYRVGDGAFTAYQSPIEIQEEGIHRIQYYARDRLGNKESPRTITVKIDKTAPTIDLKAEELTVEATGTLTPANLPVPAVKDNLDNAVQLNTEHLSKEGYPLGTTRVLYKAVDHAGNSSSSVTNVRIQDSTPPQVIFDSPQDNSYAAHTVNVRGEVKEIFLEHLFVNGKEVSVVDGRFAETIPVADDEFLVGVRAVDASGNEDSVFRTVLRDILPPRTDHDYAYDDVWTEENARIALSATDAESGMKTTYYREGNGPFLEYRRPIDIRKEGKYNIEYYSIDRVGNEEGHRNISVWIDQTPPAIKITSPKNGAYVSGKTSEVRGTVSDAFLSRVLVNGQPATVSNGDFVSTVPLEEEKIMLTAEAFDEFGHQSSDTVNVLLDSSLPVTADDYAFDNVWGNQNARIHLTATDAGSGIQATFYRIYAQGTTPPTFIPYNPGDTIAINQEGKWIVEYYSVDQVGGAESQHLISVLLDKTSPVTADNHGGHVDPTNKDVVIVLAATDAGSGVEAIYYSLDQASFAPVPGPVAVSQDGTRVLEYYALDKAGNEEARKTLEIPIDKTLPRITVDSPANGSIIAENTVAIKGTVSGDTVALTLNGQSVPLFNSTFSVNNFKLALGENRITLGAQDGVGNQTTLEITVTKVNRPPILNSIADVAINEGQAVSLSPTGSDPDGDKVTFTYAGWMSSSSRTTGYEDAGVHTVTVTASDGSLTDAQDVTVTVNNVNRPPVLDPVANVSVNEGEVTSFHPTASDPDGDSVTFMYSGWMTSSSYTTTYDDAGKHTVTVSVSDGNLAEGQNVTVIVNNVNRPPVADAQKVSLNEDTPVAIVLTGSDPDQNSLNYVLVTAPFHGTVSGSAPQVTYMPHKDYSGSDAFTFKVNDGSVDSMAATVDLLAQPVNDAPVLGPIGNKSVDENAHLEFAVTASDAEGDILTITAAPLRIWMNSDGTTFSADPGFGDSGNYTVIFAVTDGKLTDTEAIVLSVGDVNRPPQLAPIGDYSTDEGGLLQFVLSASDPDGDTLHFAASGLPAGSNFNATTRTFFWQPGYDQSGAYTNVHFEVNDGEFSDSKETAITVSNINRAPGLNPMADITVNEGATVALNPISVDPDGDKVTFTYAGWMSSSSRTTGYEDAGIYTVTVTASDGQLTDSQDVTVTVVNVNRSPVLDFIFNLTVYEGETVMFKPTASDPDGDALTFTYSGWMTSSGHTVTRNDSGSHTVIVSVFDGKNTDSQDVTVTVEVCGDGVLNGDEICDDGAQNGSPSHCNNQCGGATVAVCGNSIQETGEACDDGNKISGDGCSSSCVIERCGDGVVQMGLGETCEGNSIKSCVAGGYNGVQSCAANCAYDPCALNEYCGDGVVQTVAGEACDDGNAISGDGCSATCKLESCGDRIVQTGLGEQCDDGNKTSGDGCNANCRNEFCGDAIIQTGAGEVCDSNNRFCTTAIGYAGTQSCNVQCIGFGTCASNLFCGDGICSNLPETTINCPSDCPAICGNGIAEPSEECDDHNVTAGDGCSSTCKLEFCGDGIIQTGLGEECDDGNTINGDGCGSNCQVEQLADTTAPSVPAGLTATAVSASQINLSWTASTDNVGVTGYIIFRNGTEVGTSTTTTYQATGLTASTSYSFIVAAYDAAGNNSAPSATATAMTLSSSGETLPQTAGWYEIPNTKIFPLCPSDPSIRGASGCASVTSAWNSGVFDTFRNRLVIWGGGHNDYYGNELYALDLNTLTMSRITDPALPPADDITCPESLLGGAQPNSRHTYDGIAYMPNVDRMFVFGGSLSRCGFMSRGTWTFDFKNSIWQKMNLTGTIPHAVPGIVTGYDSNTGKIFLHDDLDLYAYTFSSDSFQKLTSNGSGIDYHMTGIVDPVKKKFVILGAGQAWVYNIGGTTFTKQPLTTTGGSTVINSDYPGLAYDPTSGRIVAWVGGDTVYQLALDAGTGGTWTTTTFSGGPGAALLNGTYKRFSYSPASNVFVSVNSVDANAYALRLSGGTGTPPPAPDTQAPTTPTNLTASVISSTQINLAWTASTDNVGVTGYKIFRNGTEVVTSVTTAFQSTGLTASTSYSFTVLAHDAARNNSVQSIAANATTQQEAPAPTPTPIPSGSQVTSFQLTSGVSGTQPFTIGLGFKKGDIPGTPSLDISTSQVIVKTRWNDGSAKMTIASGQTSFTAGAPKTVTVLTTPPASGTDLTAANIQAANPQASVSLGSYGTVNLSGLLATPFRTWISGPEMVEAHYRSNVGSDPTLQVWFYVRLYKGGRMWIRAIVENGYLDIPTADKSYAPTVTIGSTTIYTNGGVALTHYAHTRWTQEGWIGGDPQIIPQHDTTYLMNSKLVPNYWKRNPSSTVLNNLYQTYAYGQRGGWTTNMGETGYQEQIGLFPLWDALYLTSGADSRAYKSVLANAKALNNYAIVWNDSATKLPVQPGDRPTWSFDGAGGGGGNPPSAGGLQWEVAHHGSGGYLAYLITGDYYYLETMENQAVNIYLGAGSVNWSTNPSINNYGTSRYINGQTRGYAWGIRTLSQLAALAPAADPIARDYQTLLANNIAYLKSIRDTLGTTGIGYLYEYSLNAFGVPGVVSPWQEHFFIQSLGMGSDLEPLAIMTAYNDVRDWMYRGIVGILGDATGYCFTEASLYKMKISDTSNGDPVAWYPDWRTVYLNNFTSDPACANTLGGSSGGDPSAASTGYWGNLLPAIAYAVDHGAPGASAAWTRLTGATNWPAIANSGFDDTPVWGIAPRQSSPSPTPTPTPIPSDTTPPAIPGNLTAAVVSSSQINLSWTASTDNVGVTGYKIFRNGTEVGTSTTTSFQNTGLTASTSYSFTVSANDAAGNDSAPSASVSATTQSSGGASAITTLAASMQPGTWAALTTNNINPTFTGVNGATGHIIPFAENMVWDAASRKVLFVGGDHIYAKGDDYPRFVRYSVDTNAWEIMPRPSWFGAGVMHAYDGDAYSPATGNLYYLTPDGAVTYKYNLASSVWSTLPNLPNSVYSCCESIAYFPEMAGVVFIHAGNVFLFKEATGQWSTLASGLSTSYHSIAEYNPVHKVVIFGGGSDTNKKFYKLNSFGQVTALAAPPISLDVPRIAVTVDPITGDYLVFDNAKNFYKYNVVTDTWQLQPNSAASVPIWNSDPTSLIGGVVHVPLPEYGVTMFVTCDGSCKVNLYKSASGATLPPADTTAPSVPGGVIAMAVSNSQINLTWNAATDNVGVAGYKIFRNGTEVGTATATTYQNTGLTADTSYSFTVSAFDAAGNNSNQSTAVNATTQQAATPPPSGQVVFAITTGSDDVYDDTSLTLIGQEAWFGFWDNANEQIGLRFQDITIPQGATIASAVLSVQASSTEDDSNPVLGKIRAKAMDNAAAWNATTNSVSQGPYTTAGVDWDAGPWAGGSTQTSPNITSVIQEIVNRAGWTSGNALSLVILNDGTTGNADRGMKMFESGTPATLTISYATGNAPVVSAISTNPTDVDTATPGVQFYAGTSVSYSASVSDPNNSPLTWTWYYTINGGARTSYLSGTGTVQPAVFNYSSSSAGTNYQWILSVSDGTATTEQSLNIAIISAPVQPPPSGTLVIPSLQDERATYTSWGWTWTTDKEPNVPANPTYSVGNPDIHNDTEGDDLWSYLMMYRRTGQQGYLDRARAWADYFKNRYRTSAFFPNDTDFLNDHLYGWGLVAWYEYTCETATCDTAALTEAENLGAIAEGYWSNRSPGWNMAFYSLRQGARHLLLSTRLAEVTGKARWITLRDKLIDLWLASPDWDPRGMYFHGSEQTDIKFGAGAYAAGDRYISSFQISILSEALRHAYRTTGRTGLRDRIVSMARFVDRYGLDPTYQYVGSTFGILRDGSLYHNYSAGGTATFWDPVYTTSLVNVLVQGYKYTGDITLLDKAKIVFNRGTKGLYGSPTARAASDTQVHHFVDSTFESSSGGFYLGFNKGELQYTYLLFENGGSPMVVGTPPAADTIAPSVPSGLVASAVSATQINLSWSASTDNVGVTGYKIFRNGTEVGTSTTTTFQNTGLAASTSYSFAVSANDAAGNNSAQSGVAGATTPSVPDTTAPTVSIDTPAANATVNGSVSLTATAADAVGVTGVQFLLDGANLGAEDTTSPYSLTWNTTATTNGSHTLTARARDAAGNQRISAAVTVTVNNPDVTVPSVPTGLTATAVSASQINLSWTASTDNVGVTGYRIFRNGVQVGASTTTTFQNTGLSAGTNYSFTVAAHDAAGNNSAPSASVSATTKSSSGASALATLAASMQPGTWAELATNNIGTALIDTGSGGVGHVLPYAEGMRWDPVTKRIYLINSDDPGDGRRFVAYDETTNSWVVLPDPWAGTGVAHQYDGTDIDIANRVIYTVMPDGNSGNQYNLNTGVFTNMPAFPGMAYSCCEASFYFPEMQGLILLNHGDLYKLGDMTHTWNGVATTGAAAVYTTYHSFAEYNPIHKVAVFGGGNDSSLNFYKLESSGGVTALAAPPVNLEVPRMEFTYDPVTGIYLVLDHQKRFHTYDVTTDTWTAQPTGNVPAAIWGTSDPNQFNTVSSPISTYGVVMFINCTFSTCKVFLYKHAAGSGAPPPAPDTQAPSVPAGLAAAAVSATQINLSWTASADNVGVTGYKIFRNGTEVGTSTTTTYQATGLTASTSYSFTVSAHDAAGNVSTASSIVNGTTLVASTATSFVSSLNLANNDTSGTSLMNLVNGSIVNLASLSTQNINIEAKISSTNGVLKVLFQMDAFGSQENAAPYVLCGDWGACPQGFFSVGAHTLTVTPYDSGGAVGTPITITFEVTNGALADTTAPSIPAGLTATAVLATQINLSWTASTDNVGATGYRVERCQGASCANFTQTATLSGTSYNDTGLAAATVYRYRLRAADAAGNVSQTSAVVEATTQQETTPPPSTSLLPSVEDEKDTYALWGWTYTAGQVPNLPANAAFTVTDPGSHNDTEGDDLWISLMMYLRGGGQGYLDRAKAWVTYYKTRYLQCLPSGGETFCFDRDNYLMDHVYGWGLVSWYEYTCQTGACDTAALTVAENIAAEVENYWAHRANNRTTYPTPSQWPMAYYDLRGPARQLLLITRVAEATGKQRWITLRDRLIDLWMQSPDWDPKGTYPASQEATDSALGAGSYAGGVRENSAFQIGILAEAFDHVYRTTGRQDVKARIIAMANYVNQFGLDPVYQYTGSRFGHKNGVPWHNYSAGGSTMFWDSVYTTSLVNTLVIGYKYSGNTALLNQAKYFLNRGTKGIYGNPATRTAGDTQVHHFIDSTFDSGSGDFYYRYNKGELQYAYLVFENGGNPTVAGTPADTTAPSVPAGLTATVVSATQINLSWSASTDNVGVSGYKIFRNGTEVGTSTTTTFQNTGLAASTSYSFAVSANDAAGNNSAQSGPVQVATLPPSNNPPVLEPISVIIVNEGEVITITPSATDSDGDTLTYSVTALPQGADYNFNPQTGELIWRTTYKEAGEYDVTISADDGRN